MTATRHTLKKLDSVQAVRDGDVGSFFIENARMGEDGFKQLWLKLPTGDACGFALAPAPAYIPGVWDWNGDEDAPALTREIHMRLRWKGNLTGESLAGELLNQPTPEISNVEEQPQSLPAVVVDPPKKKTASKKR